MELKPQTKLGKWSVWLNFWFLIVVAVSVLLVEGFSVLSFGDRWWDVTVPILFSANIAAFILGIIAIRKNKESSFLVRASIVVGLLVILFIFLHSLFIND